MAADAPGTVPVQLVEQPRWVLAGRPPRSRPQREAASVTGWRAAARGESGARPVVSARRSPGAAGPRGHRRAVAGRAEPRGCGHVRPFSAGCPLCPAVLLLLLQAGNRRSDTCRDLNHVEGSSAFPESNL